MKPAVHCLRRHLNGLALNSEIVGSFIALPPRQSRLCELSAPIRRGMLWRKSREAASDDAGPTRDGRTMKSHTKLAAALLFLIGAAELSNIAPALARGGAANIMNSPGYQRRLQESRQQGPRPDAQTPGIHRRKKWHHRHHY
jgi:hypothetical protein